MQIQTITGVSLLALAAGTASAQYYVLDTGTPTGPDTPSISLFHDGDEFQNLAGAFSIEEATTLTGVEAYLRRGGAGELTYAIFADTGTGVPDPGNVLHSISTTTPDVGRDWYGVSGLSWDVPAGDFWLVLLPEFDAYNTSMPNGAPNPTNLAFESEMGPWGVTGSGLSTVGFRVSAIPAPGSVLLLSMGGVAILRRGRSAS